MVGGLWLVGTLVAISQRDAVATVGNRLVPPHTGNPAPARPPRAAGPPATSWDDSTACVVPGGTTLLPSDTGIWLGPRFLPQPWPFTTGTPLVPVPVPLVVTTSAASGLGDLTVNEVEQIQRVVDSASRPLTVVGSAARGTRRNPETDLPIGKGEGTRSDIDYLGSPSSMPYFEQTGLLYKLPSLAPEGLIEGLHMSSDGPGIYFEPGIPPVLKPEASQ